MNKIDHSLHDRYALIADLSVRRNHISIVNTVSLALRHQEQMRDIGSGLEPMC